MPDFPLFFLITVVYHHSPFHMIRKKIIIDFYHWWNPAMEIL
ncbi:hypothetical protein Mpal_0786 [Methanosphaerula palustris E1-9c]|uniref:Uncharacterized protein n=1 Tax=Methanosphaerula palustris (strain ATCC BAA-1556 / DSM 19958 / E1-9c) TaxID=521011 RepID=B8GG74_METPE|nr:hypothetical protein Mpal_0786 [Methanosphaerula palustris E1-9c]